MPSPLSYDHGEEDNDVGGWLFHYKVYTPGVHSPNNATVKLDRKGEPQPDCQLFIPAEHGGQVRIDDEGYITGAPELVVEIARSSRHYDLGQKKADYERAGVLEYVVVELDPDRIHWFIRRGDHFEDLPPGPDGIYRSEVFPGLWLDPVALFTEDRRRLLQRPEAGPGDARSSGLRCEAGRGSPPRRRGRPDRPDSFSVGGTNQAPPSLRTRTSSWSIFWTRCLATKTWATGIASFWAASAPERPSIAVSWKASQVAGLTRPLMRCIATSSRSRSKASSICRSRSDCASAESVTRAIDPAL